MGNIFYAGALGATRLGGIAGPHAEKVTARQWRLRVVLGDFARGGWQLVKRGLANCVFWTLQTLVFSATKIDTYQLAYCGAVARISHGL